MTAALLCAEPEDLKKHPPIVDSNHNAQQPPKPPEETEQVAEKPPAPPSSTETTARSLGTYEVTAYTARCDGCVGITKTGVDVRNTIKHEGKRIVAVDPSLIPLGSTIELRLANGRTIEATAQDTGGAIKGRRLDLLVTDRATAIEFGRQSVEVRIIEEGKN